MVALAQAGLVAGVLVPASALAASSSKHVALPYDVGALEANGPARPVAAWTEFCRRYPAECAVDMAEPATVPLTPKLWRTLNQVNRQVNHTIRPKTDLEHWAVVDRWDLAEDGLGDCEDYQLLKRRILVTRQGLPRRALRMTVVIDDQGEGHAVLTVHTDGGDVILDNKRDAILPWHETGYVFVKREGQDGSEWVSLGDRTAPVATANR